MSRDIVEYVSHIVNTNPNLEKSIKRGRQTLEGYVKFL